MTFAVWEHNPDRTLWLYIEPNSQDKLAFSFKERRRFYGFVARWENGIWLAQVEGREGEICISFEDARAVVEKHWRNRKEE